MAVQISGNDITVPRDTSVTRNLTVGGVLTYEDVTNVDSVGLVTARSGIEIGARPGVGASISVDGNAIFSGITTATTIKSNTGIVTTLTSTTFNVDGGDATFKGTTSARDVVFDTSLNQIRAQDNAKLCAGSSSDLEVYHNATNSYIDNYTGHIYVRNNVSSDNGGNIYLQAKTGENGIIVNDDGAVELYYDNVKTFETKDIGAIVYNNTGSGNRVFDIKNPSNDYAFISLNDQNTTANSSVRIGALANEMLIYAGGSERIRVSDDGKIGFNNTDPSAAIEVTFDSGGSAPSSGTAPEGIAISYGTADGKNGGIWFSPGFGDDQGISGINANRTSGYQTDLRFYTNNTNSARAFSERMRILPDGRITTNGLDGATDITTTGTGDTYDGMVFGTPPLRVTRTSACPMFLNRNGSGGNIQEWRYGGNIVGYVSNTGNSLPSDRNYKKNITNLSLGLDLVNKLQPVSYHYKFDADSDPVMYGLVAQDVKTALNDAGVAQNTAAILQYEEKNDEKDSDYSLDYTKLTPILINAVKELSTEIESLKSEIAALKSS